MTTKTEFIVVCAGNGLGDRIQVFQFNPTLQFWNDVGRVYRVVTDFDGDTIKEVKITEELPNKPDERIKG